MMGKCPSPQESPGPPATQSTSCCPFTPGLLSLHTKDQGMREECSAFGPQPIMGPETYQFRHSQRGSVSFLPLLPFICWSAATKELASILLSYLRYLSYLKLSKGAFNSFFVPCSLLSEKGALGCRSSALALPQSSTLHVQCWGRFYTPGRSSVLPWKKHMKAACLGPEHAESKASERLSSPVALRRAQENLFELCWRILLRLPGFLQPFPPQQPAERSLLMLAPPQDINCFLLFGGTGFPASRWPGLNPASPTNLRLCRGKSCSCLQGEGSPVCLPASAVSLAVVSSQKDRRHWSLLGKKRALPKINENKLVWVRPSKCLGKTAWLTHFQMS